MAGTLAFWSATAAALAVRIVISFYAADLNLGFRPEVATPLTSLRRLAEGYWLKNSSMSPYSGSMYHGSPLLLPLLGPLTIQSTGEQNANWQCNLLFVIVDFITALLIRAIGQNLLSRRSKTLEYLKLPKLIDSSGYLNAGNIASTVYLWNPLTILTCVGSSTSAVDNLMVVLSIYGACSRLPSLAAFGWVLASHLSLYPVILIVPIILLLGYGPDAPPRKLFQLKDSNASQDSASSSSHGSYKMIGQTKISWKPVLHFIFWSAVWAGYVLFLCCASLKDLGGLSEMFKKMYGFMLTVEDLSPNIGVQWYFFAEVFNFFRNFFLIVFHMNVFFMVFPLAICLKHRPCFLAFVYIAISSMLKSYPSVGDSALYLGLLGLFANELAEMHFSFLLFWGYVGVTLLSPVMHNLWIWRGTGNANFYFATGLAYACLQTVLIVESVSTMLKYDRMIKKQVMARQ